MIRTVMAAHHERKLIVRITIVMAAAVGNIQVQQHRKATQQRLHMLIAPFPCPQELASSVPPDDFEVAEREVSITGSCKIPEETHRRPC